MAELPTTSEIAAARAAFPVLERIAFLNAGTYGPLARSTVEAIATAVSAETAGGRGSTPYYADLHELRTAIRAGLAAAIGVDAHTVALTYSTTSACQIVLSGMGLTSDDEVVTTDEEHFGLLGPLHASEARVRLAPTRGRSADEALAAILGAVGPRTKLIALSHVSWLTGNELPAVAVKEATRVPVLVDGAQSAGAIPVDASAFDFYTVSGQKWLCGPDAIGALHVSDADRLAIRLPTYWGRSEHEADGTFTPVDGATRFDAGAIPMPSLAGMAAALEVAPPWRFEVANDVATRCRERLASHCEMITAPDQATLVTFRPEEEPTTVVDRLREAGVIVRALPGTPWVRASCGYWTNDEDIDRLIAGLHA